MNEVFVTVGEVNQSMMEADPLYQQGFRAGMLAAAEILEKRGSTVELFAAEAIREAAKK